MRQEGEFLFATVLGDPVGDDGDQVDPWHDQEGDDPDIMVERRTGHHDTVLWTGCDIVSVSTMVAIVMDTCNGDKKEAN